MGNIVYKFRDWKIPFHKENLTEGMLYFASPTQFNDPFDCLIVPRYDLLIKQQKTEKYRDLIRHDNPYFSARRVNQEVKKWMGMNLLSGNNYLQNAEKKLKMLLRYGIFSLSRVNDNILLWSHYADSHHGFCIGYDEEELYDFVINSFKVIGMIADKRNINYSDSYPIIIPHKNITGEEYIITPITTKSSDWAYEKEVRIILYDGANTKLKLVKKRIVKEIILGCYIQQQDKDEIIGVAKKNYPGTKILEAKKHPEKFKLVFDEIK
ncbi:MAG: hypothetical protein A2057_11655 [Ignavibacteria bacterium GWA2_35_9]|nr:MAG: hypothetical protein A2057_11655 [Ignavibacteria bacterium GWA2_35_9]OGU44191.1 MAG: hypothetical protein A2000_17330 [Ignavibacteria bacterium GWB2_36_8]OGU53631.1 MAG: hypothetical protein A2080_00025 [Ignavibacteria bacterium GWC2_36_12]OGU98739.1 MAG: hypothetical protein A2330_06880 [Ignavibacteria bacterium RIFOXYB2_FULL_36_7]